MGGWARVEGSAQQIIVQFLSLELLTYIPIGNYDIPNFLQQNAKNLGLYSKAKINCASVAVQFK